MDIYGLLVVLFVFIVVLLAIWLYQRSEIKRYENYARALGEMYEQEQDEIKAALATSERAPTAETLEFYERIKQK